MAGFDALRNLKILNLQEFYKLADQLNESVKVNGDYHPITLELCEKVGGFKFDFSQACPQ